MLTGFKNLWVFHVNWVLEGSDDLSSWDWMGVSWCTTLFVSGFLSLNPMARVEYIIYTYIVT